MTTLTGKRIEVTRGIDVERFATLKRLTALYEQLQLCSVEAGYPGEDLFSFASRTAFFGVINHILYNTGWDTSVPEYRKPLDYRDEIHQSRAGSSSQRAKAFDPLELDEEDVWSTEPFSHRWKASPSSTKIEPEHEQAYTGPIGIVYLISTQQPPYPPGSIGELSLGIILQEENRGKGYAQETLALVLEEAFRNLDCHRIHVNLLDTSSKDKVMALFIRMRFAHEGKRRRSFFSILEQEWKDTTSLAILDTDWMVRSKFLTKPVPTSLWDEMLSRHDRERQQLMCWEDEQTQSWPKWLKRTASMETIRMSMSVPAIAVDSSDESESSVSDAEDVGSSHLRPHGVGDPSSDGFFDFLPPSAETGKGKDKGKGKGKRDIDSAAADPFDVAYPSSDSEDDVYPPRKNLRFDSPADSSSDDEVDRPQTPLAFRRNSLSPSPSVATAPSPSPSVSSDFEFHIRPRFPSRSRSSSVSLDSVSDPESDAGASDNDGYASSTSSSQWDLLEMETHSAASPTSSSLEIWDNEF